jgi:3-oxoacyl-[acyl-carrier-protein] synthase II
MTDEPIVVTGMGAVTPIGLDLASTWDSLKSGRSGLGYISAFDRDDFGVETAVAAEVDDFVPEDHLDRRSARRLDRVAQFAAVAAHEAMGDAGLLSGDGSAVDGGLDLDRVGVYVSAGIGGIRTLCAEEKVLHERGARRVSPFLLPMFLPDAIPGSIAIRYGLRGPNMAHLSACASGANAIGEAFATIRRGDVDLAVAGGAEACIIPLMVAAFNNMGALSKWQGEPALASRPFDAERDGFVIGEGAAVIVLERAEHARARGARARAELAGYATTADAVHITAPAEDGAGMVAALRRALEQAQISPSDIDYVNAHGTSTPLNDAAETKVIREVFGERAHDVPVSSIKSMIGHLLGAGGAVEAAATVLTLESGIIPPTINLHTPDPECDLDYVPNLARRPTGGVAAAASNSMGFGGHNVALVFRKL